MKNTHITFILDRSGSMFSIREQTISGFNNFVNEQKKLPGYASLSLIQFDDTDPFEIIEDFTDIRSVKQLDASVFIPRGSTPLYDAIGKGIAYTEQNIKKYSQNKPVEVDDFDTDSQVELVIFVILTDGYENASKEFTHESIKNLITEKKNSGWEVVFLGANMDAVEVGTSMGVNFGKTMSFSASGASGAQGFQGIAGATYAMNNLTSSLRGGVDYNFTIDDQEKAMKGY